MTDLIGIYVPKNIHDILRDIAHNNHTTISAEATKILQKELIKKKPNIAFAKYTIEEHKEDEK